MLDEALSLVSIWASMVSWLTPTFLFFFLNFMIATIFLTSSFTSPHPPPPPPPQQPPQQQQQQQHQQDHQQPPSAAAQITRAPSLIHRLKSINFSSYIPTSTPQPSSPELKPKPEISPYRVRRVRAPIIKEDRVEEDEGGDEEGPTLDEIYSRIKGISSGPGHNRQNSDTLPIGGDIPVKLSAKIRKSASDKSAFNHFDAAATATAMAAEHTVEREGMSLGSTGTAESDDDTEVEVDAMADDFISRFKKQLQLQRLDSILRYKDMITRGSAK